MPEICERMGFRLLNRENVIFYFFSRAAFITLALHGGRGILLTGGNKGLAFRGPAQEFGPADLRPKRYVIRCNRARGANNNNKLFVLIINLLQSISRWRLELK